MDPRIRPPGRCDGGEPGWKILKGPDGKWPRWRHLNGVDPVATAPEGGTGRLDPSATRLTRESRGGMAHVGPERLAQLYDAHGPALRLYARQWRDPEGAEDLVQEAFLALARQPGEPVAVVAWLYQTVRNAALMRHRGERRRRERERRVADREPLFQSADDAIDAATATALLAELEPELREVVVARIWGGLGLEAIASLQGCSVTTAHRRYYAGLTRLQQRLDGPCPSPSHPTPPANPIPASPPRPAT